MARAKISETKVSPKYNHTKNHHVDYYLYKVKKAGVVLPEDKPGQHCSGYCFSGLMRCYRKAVEKPNRLLYIMPDDNGNIKLTLKEKREFAKLSRKHGLLPKYFKYEWIGKDRVSKIVLDLKDLPMSLIYAYLCNFRYIREDPGFVRALVYLVNTRKMNFYVAYVLASRICLSHGGHAVIEPIRPYMDKTGDPNNISLNVSRMVALYRYLRNPKKYDKRTLDTTGEWADYNCQISITSACRLHLETKSTNAFNNKLTEIIKMGDAKIEEEMEVEKKWLK